MRTPILKFVSNRYSILRFFSSNKRICIIGSGPAGFYTAQYILKNSDAEVDVFEKLPVPFGLIRYGVAPDHPEIKVVTNTFAKIALHDKFRFFGNVDVGQDVTLTELLQVYHAVVLAFGASEDKELKIPGENLQNVLSARKFVSWYNGHPDSVHLKVALNTNTVTVVGNGNVALDVARILLKKAEELKSTDIADHAMDALLKSRVRRVVLVGRRGPLQAAFTIKELREIINLKGITTKMDLADFHGIPDILESLPRPKKRLVELLLNTARAGHIDAEKTLEFKFFRSPKSILSDDNGKAKAVVLGVNELEGTGEVVSLSNKKEEVETGLVLRSIGYQSRSMDPRLPFDTAQNIIPNKRGRVIGQEGLYCSGWVKTGPSGVILSTMNGSFETGETLLQDMEKEKCFQRNVSGRSTVTDILKSRGIKAISFNDWLKIDQVEVQRGNVKGKLREKVCSHLEMLQIAGAL